MASSKHGLRKLLAQRNQFPLRSKEIDKEIRRLYERDVAVLVLDMSGFSRTSNKHGIIHFLAMVAKMEAAARPAVEGNSGTVIKQEADNLFAVFPRPREALESAVDILRAFDSMNTVLPPDSQILGSIGIGYGPTLVLKDADLFGIELNFASKLGEDFAQPSEVLLTQAAHEALGKKSRHLFTQKTFAAGGVTIEAFQLKKA